MTTGKVVVFGVECLIPTSCTRIGTMTSRLSITLPVVHTQH